MSITNCYASLAELKTRLYSPNAVETDLLDDSTLLAVLESISRLLDRMNEGRAFYPRTATRYYTAQNASLCFVEDLLAVTALKSDSDGDRIYETTWSAADYDLEPYSAPTAAPPRPYTRIVPSPNSAYRFSSVRKGIEIAGTFGFFNITRTANATLNEALDISETAVDVSSGIEFSPGQTILIDSEQMHVQRRNGNTLDVTRAANGTTAVAHYSAAAIQIYEYPLVNEICLLQTARLYKRKDAIFGVVGSAELGQQIIIPKLDPDIALMLRSFQRVDV